MSALMPLALGQRSRVRVPATDHSTRVRRSDHPGHARPPGPGRLLADHHRRHSGRRGCQSPTLHRRWDKKFGLGTDALDHGFRKQRDLYGIDISRLPREALGVVLRRVSQPLVWQHQQVLSEEFSWRGRSVRWGRAGVGPAVVFCHGTPWSSDLWRPIAEALAPYFTVYLWDMPGYGGSSKNPEHRVSLDVQGELFSDLLTLWDLRSPHVVAHDYGGAVALRGHLLHGSGVASLVLVDVVALRPWGSDFFRLVRDHVDVFGALPPAVHEGALRAYISGASYRGLAPDALDALALPWLGDGGQAAFYHQIAEADELYTAQVEPLYPAIDVPVLVIWGRDDEWIPVDRAYRLHQLIPGARLTVIEQAGHLVQLDQPEALTAALTQWLRILE